MRGRNLIKLLTAVDLLSRQEGATINELAERLEIDRRSVYRLLNVVEELHFPLYDETPATGKEKRWRLVDEYVTKLPNMSIPDVKLSLSEMISLYLLKGEAKLYRGTEIEKTVDSAFEKISLHAPRGLHDQLQRIKTLFVPASKFAKDYSGKEEIIDTLMEAMLKKRVCFVEYHSFSDDRVKNFKIDPLYFFENHGGLCVFVNATSFGEIRILAVERIQKVELTEDAFEYPADFDPGELLDSAFDIVYDDPLHAKIRFSADQARYIKERTWAPGQRISDQPDGSIILELRTSGWWDVKRWVLSFGAEAEVLEPAPLRSEVMEELSRARTKYLDPEHGR